ncbi:MAG: pseudouridine synthase [Chloroflexota bacterium]
MAKERVHKLMAQANIASRRASEKIIEAGRVTVNGKVITVGDKADPAKDRIEVDGKPLHIEDEKIYVAVHKPINVISTNKGHVKDDRPTIREILPLEGHLFTVGRLDAESTGLVVMTNDGDLANRLSHPRYRHTKTYKVEVHGTPNAESLKKWQEGVYLEEGKTAPCIVRIKHAHPKYSTLEIIMTEGKNRQIRRIASMLGYPVHRLTRVAIGRFHIGKLKPNEYKVLTQHDVNLLKTPDPDIELIPGFKSKQRAFRKSSKGKRRK